MTAPARPARFSLLRSLGLVGWDASEAVVVAALATEEPLLLVGPHGSGKTMLLNRLAEVLGLSHRHYNASILSFDDLVGFPVPKDGGVVYLQTPATIWDAESVLVDEISRCRPEVQNKLFPLIHERVVQGMPLPRLRFRWAAMNPPVSLDGPDPKDGSLSETCAEAYAGSEPLDVALADRFAYILRAPILKNLTLEEQREVLRPAPWRPEEIRDRVLDVIGKTRAYLAEVEKSERATAAEYTILVAGQLESSGHPLSIRRACQLTRNILAVRAAALATFTKNDPERDYLSALRASVPDLAWGRPVPYPVHMGAHRAAWTAAGLASGSTRRQLLTERDPFARMAIALYGTLPPEEATGVLVDSYASLPRHERLVAAAVLMPTLSRRRDLPAAALEPIAMDWAAIASGKTGNVAVGPGASWKRIVLTTDLPRLDQKTEKGKSVAAVSTTLLWEGYEFQTIELEQTWDRAVSILRGKGRAAA